MPADPIETSTPLAEISQGPGAFELFLDKNQKGIVVFAIVLALAAVGIVVYRGIETSRQETAGAALTKASDLAAYKAVVDGNADTKGAGSAMVLLADSQWTAGQQDDAIGTLRKFLESYPGHPAVPTAKASMGSKLMSQGKSGDAAKIFEDLTSDPDAKFLAPYALIALGDMARAAGDLDKARESYEKVSNYPESNFAETATKRLAVLKSKAPVEIDAPPTPPPAPSAPANGAQTLPGGLDLAPVEDTPPSSEFDTQPIIPPSAPPTPPSPAPH